MARTKFASPDLVIHLTEEQKERAIKSSSGGCLVADAIKEQYPHLTKISVDMATIRATDRKAGVRYIYLTPPTAQQALLGFDQGWPLAIEEIRLRRAVAVAPIRRPKKGPTSTGAVAIRREARIAELETKIAEGAVLTRGEKSGLTRMRKAKPSPARPSSTGRAEVQVNGHGVTVAGGQPPRLGDAHPNLLRGRDRHFGAKLADPGEAFREAVDAAVAEKLRVAPTIEA